MSSLYLNNGSALQQDDLETSAEIYLHHWWHFKCKGSIISACSPCIAGLNSTSFSPEVLSCPLEVEHKVLWELPGIFALWPSHLAFESTWITPVPPPWNSFLQNVYLPTYLFEPGFSHSSHLYFSTNLFFYLIHFILFFISVHFGHKQLK